MPRSRFAAAIAVIEWQGPKILLVGGWNPTEGVLTSVDEYDPVLDQWTAREPMSTPRTGLAAAVVDGIVYAIAGENSAGAQSVVEAYDPSKDITRIPRIVADAGPDQTVNEGLTVILNGCWSSGPLPLTYHWERLAGTPVELSDSTSCQTTFVAPLLPGGFGSQALTFQLTVINGNQSSTDTVNITVVNVNHAPVAHADSVSPVREGSLVSLSGGNSYDPDGDPLIYQWVQTSGPSVELTGASTAAPSFTAPLLPGGISGTATLGFQLTVLDGALTGTDEVVVVVEQENHPPVANAGGDQMKSEGSGVALNGGASSDPDSDPLYYSWNQVSGPTVALSDPNSPAPTFMAPPVGPGGAALVFQLEVTDTLATSVPAQVTVTVQNINDPPRCDLARASQPVLWPPDHKLISIGIVNVTDPDNDRVTIAITGVTQDEPVNGLGDGDTSPDAVLQGEQVLLRVERSGTGNGRVYRVHFTADDHQTTGGMCTGSVTVGVPPSRKPGISAMDDGYLYDGTQP